MRQSRDKRVFFGLPAVRDATDGKGRRKENKGRVRLKCPGISYQESGVLGDKGMWGGLRGG